MISRTPTDLALLSRDRHVRRDGDDYGVEFLTFLPTGQAWPREPGSTLFSACTGLAYTYGFVDSRAADLLERESDPRKTVELLPDWERNWGLPDPCFPGTWITTWHPDEHEWLINFWAPTRAHYDSFTGALTEDGALDTHYITNTISQTQTTPLGSYLLIVDWHGTGLTPRSLKIQLTTFAAQSGAWVSEFGSGVWHADPDMTPGLAIDSHSVVELPDGFKRSALTIHTTFAERLATAELILTTAGGDSYQGLDNGSGVQIRSASLRQLISEQTFVQPPIGERQKMLVMVMIMLGAQSREWFRWVGEWIGFPIYLEQWTEEVAPGVTVTHNASIHEWSPFTAGISHCGDTRMMYDKTGYYRWEIGPPEMRFYWTVQPSTAAVIWFRCASGQAGVDPHCRVGTAEDIACLFQRWKPAHTEIVFDYSSLAIGGPMQGTP